MNAKQLRRLAEAIGGKFCGRVPKGGDPAGLAAFYQARRLSSLPLLEPDAEEPEDQAAAPGDPATAADGHEASVWVPLMMHD